MPVTIPISSIIMVVVIGIKAKGAIIKTGCKSPCSIRIPEEWIVKW
jgi:hypothetical protein